MTEGIAAIQARVAVLQSQFAQITPRSGVSSAQQFATRLTTEQQKAAAAGTTSTSPSAPAAGASGTSGTASTSATTGTTGTNGTTGTTGTTATEKAHEHSKVLGGGDRITATMKKVIDDVDAKFGPFPTIGAWRADGGMPGSDHPTGKAADFMITTGGRMPSSAKLKEGWEVANYVKDNAGKLGIKYIIFAQHIWSPARADEGWRLMEDRGSVTQNHFDHVHISVEK
ncbi:hypothetical protein GCM10010156_51320 [Planobispora rosea]|uniref:ARB-07466-like C-terminal domain-containing protein n=1 Tax=Planobispora rosea TaxID=35762 RepID=A0A8J3S4K3_PLARO|nr:hypothetical protein [Planobispora rosea]GGS86518.1 hypothetical protein GCM10010156_51320 [Planobispora rosea]GIH88286.1 hypothetical protein Pro02_66940 [Planobispora rosea]